MSTVVTSRRRAGRAAIITASLLAHGLVLVLLGLSTPGLREVRLSDPRAVEVELLAATPAFEASHHSRPIAAVPSSAAPRRLAASAPPAAIPALPFAPAPTRPASPAVAAGPHPEPLPGQARGDAVRQALRGSPVGCGNRDVVGLTRREREACDDAFGRRSVQTADIAAPIDPASRAAWDAAARRKEISRRRKEGPPPPGIDPTNNAGGTKTTGIGILDY